MISDFTTVKHLPASSDYANLLDQFDVLHGPAATRCLADLLPGRERLQAAGLASCKAARAEHERVRERKGGAIIALTNTVTALTVLETEKRYWQATQDRDFETMRQLTGELLVLVQVEGIASFNRRDFARHDPRGRLSTARVEIDEDSVQSRMLGDGACFVAYRVPQDFERGGEAGSSVSHNTSVLVKGDVGWQRVARTISLA